MDAVGADQHVDRDVRTVVEPCLGAVALISKTDETVAEIDVVHRKGRGNDRQKVGAMNHHVRRAVQLFAQRIERRPLQGAPILPTPLVSAKGTDALPVEARAEAEPAQDARRVRRHVDAAAYLRQLGRLFVEVNFEAGLQQRCGGGKAADTAADHRNSERCAGHLPATSGPRVGGRRSPRPRPSRAAS
jgi:hypothetical protein